MAEPDRTNADAERVSDIVTRLRDLALNSTIAAADIIEAQSKALAEARVVKPLDDDQIMEIIRECFPWRTEAKIYDLLTHEKSPPMIPQATYDVPSYRAAKFVTAIETRIRSALTPTPENPNG